MYAGRQATPRLNPKDDSLVREGGAGWGDGASEGSGAANIFMVFTSLFVFYALTMAVWGFSSDCKSCGGVWWRGRHEVILGHLLRVGRSSAGTTHKFMARAPSCSATCGLIHLAKRTQMVKCISLGGGVEGIQVERQHSWRRSHPFI